MMISRDPAIVYFAVMKTGSTSIEKAFFSHFDVIMSKEPSLKHVNVSVFEASLAGFVRRRVSREAVKVAMMREPLDWALSWYRYRSREDLIGQPNSTHGLSADEFILANLQDEPPKFAQIGSQSNFLTSRDGGIGVDLLFRYEEMDGLVSYLNKAFGAAVEIPFENVSPKRELAVSADVAARYRDMRALDYEYYHRSGRDGVPG